MIEIRTPTIDDLEAMFRRDEEAFGATFTDEQRTTWSGLVDLERFRIACDGSSLIGVAGTFALELTLPGDSIVSMAGTTWVSVAPTHRRQGVLRRLMDSVHADVDDRGEPVAGLQASEAGDLRALRLRRGNEMAPRGDRPAPSRDGRAVPSRARWSHDGRPARAHRAARRDLRPVSAWTAGRGVENARHGSRRG